MVFTVMSVRQAAKRIIEWSLVAGQAGSIGRWRHRDKAVVLAYHNVLPQGAQPSGDRSLHMPYATFEAQMDHLDRTHEVVSLKQLFEGDGERKRPHAAITFDDAYRGVIDVALPVLHRRGIPATIFVAPGLLGDRSLWWDLLADPDTGVVPPEVRMRALERHRGRHDVVVRAEEPRIREMPSHARTVTVEELLEATARFDVALASHTWGHANLLRLEPAEVESEVERADQWLRKNTGGPSAYLAYPYGLCNRALETRLSGLGMTGFGLQGGMVSPVDLNDGSTPLPRINIPAGLSLRGFELRASGVFAGR